MSPGPSSFEVCASDNGVFCDANPKTSGSFNPESFLDRILIYLYFIFGDFQIFTRFCQKPRVVNSKKITSEKFSPIACDKNNFFPYWPC